MNQIKVTNFVFGAVLPCLLAGQTFLRAAQTVSNPVGNSYETRADHDPDGIGKFYLGREIAHVMGHEGATWLERPEREEEEQGEKLLEALKLTPGMVVADIGAGTGYYSRRMARPVSPGGKVLAVDIQPEMLELLGKNMHEQGITNVVPVLGSITDPHLPTNAVDLVLMVDVYHEFDFPSEMMQAICKSLKPHGRVVFVEFRAEDPAVPIKLVHKMSEAQVRKEMTALPVEWKQTVRVLPRQHIIEFVRDGEVLFADNFCGTLGPGWSWVREHKDAWRVTQHGLEVRVEPGNMWGPQNDARNLLVRQAPDSLQGELQISAKVQNAPTQQYEQADLAWFYNDSNMVKLGLELVDGQVSVVMGREENDRAKTAGIVPVHSNDLRLRFLVKGRQIRGEVLTSETNEWRHVGECELPEITNLVPKLSLQFYQGSETGHWAQVTEFRVVRRQ
jgi:SAM-dependent methyltransferase